MTTCGDCFEELCAECEQHEDDCECALEAAYASAAQERHATDEVEIEQDGLVSVGNDGAWVQAWVFVPKSEVRDA